MNSGLLSQSTYLGRNPPILRGPVILAKMVEFLPGKRGWKTGGRLEIQQGEPRGANLMKTFSAVVETCSRCFLCVLGVFGAAPSKPQSRAVQRRESAVRTARGHAGVLVHDPNAGRVRRRHDELLASSGLVLIHLARGTRSGRNT